MPGSKNAQLYDNSMFNILRKSQLFLKNAAQFYISTKSGSDNIKK